MVLRACGILALTAMLFASASGAGDKKETGGGPWFGSVDDEALMKLAPEEGVIVSAKKFQDICKAWKFDAPKVDFDKDLVVVGTTRGSKIGGKPLVKDGDLKALFISTRDLRPGFRYIMVTHAREGVKTVNGKPLPKE